MAAVLAEIGAEAVAQRLMWLRETATALAAVLDDAGESAVAGAVRMSAEGLDEALVRLVALPGQHQHPE
jgi:hypothetical protein